MRLAIRVFLERYGMTGRGPRSVEEVARAHGIRRATVRRLEVEVLQALKRIAG